MSGFGVNQDLGLDLPSAFDRIKKKVASAPKHSMASAMSEADEKAGALARYFQATPAKASPKHPDARKMTLCTWNAYSHLAALHRTRSAAKAQSRAAPANIIDAGLGHSTENAAVTKIERSMSADEGTSFLETLDTSSLVSGR